MEEVTMLNQIKTYRMPLFAAALLGLTLPVLAADPAGTWTAAEGKSRVKVNHCGANLCGNLVWLREPTDENGKPKLDYHNANTGLRSRPMIGVTILESMVPEGDLWRGRIYNAEDGKTYSATFKMLTDNSAQVQGCVAAIFCKTQIWTRN